MRRLLTPDSSRWKPMLMGLLLAGVALAAAAYVRGHPLLEGVLVIFAITAWSIGACAMVGYARWFFASELSAARERTTKGEKEKD
jgi:hypothetical protein